MAYRMYEFRCPKYGHTIESLETPDTREIVCHECGSAAKRIVSAPISVLDGASGDFPGEALKWERRHR